MAISPLRTFISSNFQTITNRQLNFVKRSFFRCNFVFFSLRNFNCLFVIVWKFELMNVRRGEIAISELLMIYFVAI